MANDDKSQNIENSTSSIHKRARSKRKIRAPDKPLFNFNLVASDSEDDEDFVASSDGEGNSSDDASEKEDATNQTDESLSESSSSEGTADEEEGVGAEDSILTEERVQMFNEGNILEESPLVKQQSESNNHIHNETSTTLKSSKDVSDILICGICLETESTEEDELVECDNCGITVHEGCYGDTEDSVSEDKSDSDADTEPWFCDVCKAKVNAACELCPNKGGILKQTDTGKWVHLICAIYVPGVGFRDVDRLRMIVLEDIGSARWGARRCVLCEDQRFSKTGVCIGCDAGLCKTFFHAVCAQKHGLLIEIPDAGKLDDSEADELYAHCKVHTDKEVMKSRKLNWLAFQAHAKNFKRAKDPVERERISVAYEHACNEYSEFLKSNLKAKPPSVDKPRLLTTCPEACEMLVRKAELLEDYRDHELSHHHIEAKGGAIFKPNLTTSFIHHFFKREKWLKECDEKHRSLQESIKRNQSHQIILQEKWDDMISDSEKLTLIKKELASKITSIHSAVELIVGEKLAKPRILSPAKKVKKETNVASIEEFVHVCAECNATDNQHLMAQCDNCDNFYHIQCLDPPLTHLPKKGPKWFWHCTNCDESESSEESVDLDEPIAKRRKRISTAPKKFTPSDEEKQPRKNNNASRGRGRPRKNTTKQQPQQPQQPSTDSVVKVESPLKTTPVKLGRKRTKIEEIFDDCSVCGKKGDNKNMVSCDDCSKLYHFECCEPKLKTNPKRRGYLWICTECTDSDEDDDSDNDDENEKYDENDKDETTKADDAPHMAADNASANITSVDKKPDGFEVIMISDSP